MKKKSIIVLTLLLSLLVIIVLNNSQSESSNDSEPRETIVVSKEYPISDDIYEIAEQSNYIVLGSYSNFNKSWNMSRDVNDISKESEVHYREGKIYDFTIEEVIKGDITNASIKVNHAYLSIIPYTESNAVINDEGIIIEAATESQVYNIERVDGFFIEPEIGAKYVLFLKYDSDFDNYYAALEPFMVKVKDDGITELQSNLLSDSTIRASLEKTKHFIRQDTYVEIIDETLTSNIIKDNISGMQIESFIEFIK